MNNIKLPYYLRVEMNDSCTHFVYVLCCMSEFDPDFVEERSATRSVIIDRMNTLNTEFVSIYNRAIKYIGLYEKVC